MESQKALRTKGLLYGIATGVAGKIAAIFLQVFSLPVAAYALSVGDFSQYATLTAIVSWLALSNLGLGIGLTIQIAPSLANSDVAKACSLFQTALWTTISIIGLLFVGLLLFSFLGNPGYFNHLYASVVFLIVAALLFLGTVEGLQAAHQRTFVTNMFGLVGTIVTAMAVLLCAWYFPYPLVLLIAMQAPSLALRLINSFIFLRKNSYYLFSFGKPKLTHLRLLLISGLNMTLGSSVTNFLSHVYPVLLVSSTKANTDVAALAVVMHAVILISSLYGIINSPMIAAAGHAHAASDTKWLRSAYLRTIAINLSFGILTFFVVFLWGQPLVQFWYPKLGPVDNGLIVAAGAYLITQAVDTTNYTFLSSMRRIHWPNYLHFSKSVVYATVLFFSVSESSVAWPLVLLLVSSIVFSVPGLSIMIYRVLTRDR